MPARQSRLGANIRACLVALSAELRLPPRCRNREGVGNPRTRRGFAGWHALALCLLLVGAASPLGRSDTPLHRPLSSA